MTGAITFDEIKTALEHKDVDVPEWGGTVRIVALTAKERSELEMKYAGKGGDINPYEFRCDVLRSSLKDWLPQGRDVSELMDLSASAVERLFNASLQLSGFSEKDVEEMEGN